ncbi:MAG: CoA transferase [Pseudomonadota bacterium]
MVAIADRKAALCPGIGQRLLETLRATLQHVDGKALAIELERRSIPFAAICRPQDLFDDPHLKASGGLAKLTLEDGSQTDMQLLPIALDGERLLPRMPIAHIGEHTHDILRELGYTDQQIAGFPAPAIGKN